MLVSARCVILLVLSRFRHHFQTAMSTAYPQAAPDKAAGSGPLKVPAEKLRGVLGVREMNYVQGSQPLATIDTPAQAMHFKSPRRSSPSAPANAVVSPGFDFTRFDI
jgi:hypothetical protein